MKKIATVLILVVTSFTAAAIEIPALTGHINDYAKMLEPQQAATMEQRLVDFEKQTGTQIVVLIVPTLQGVTIEQFGIEVASRWKIGQKKIDNGVLFIWAPKERKVRFEVGYGLEGVLTDALCKIILRNEVSPQLKNGQYALGINAGINALMKASRNEYKATATTSPKSSKSSKYKVLWWFVIPFILAVIAHEIFNRLAASATGGIISGLIGYLLFGVVGAVIAAILGLIIGLIARDIIVGLASISSSGGSGGGYGGSSYGGDSSSSGSSYSGGGGSFGGGGASDSY